VNTPKVTVLMPVHNGERYIREAIDSILAQSFTGYELLIINDGSTDQSVEIIESYNEPRIRLIHNYSNLGLVPTLNWGLHLARGEFVARMDCDDISHPERLDMQVSYMDIHEDVAVCGSWIKAFGSQHFVKKYPLTDDRIRAHMLFENALAHPSVMMRRNVFISERLFYDVAYTRAEDYELWTRVPASYKLANIGRILLYYRMHRQQVSAEFISDQSDVTCAIRKKQLNGLDMDLSEESSGLHMKISQKKPELSISFLDSAAVWLMALQEKNVHKESYDCKALSEMTGMYWWETCFHATTLGFCVWKRYFKSPLNRQARVSLTYLVLFWVKCLLKKRNTSFAA